MTDDVPRVFIGVDGGASKTHVIALDRAGQSLGEASGPAATLNGTAETAWATIIDTIGRIDAIGDTALDDCALVVGIAGTEIAAAYRAFCDRAPSCAALEIVSDAHIACAGAHDLADGAIVAVGTGVVGFCRFEDTTARAGGWGFPHDDRGSGAWLGLEAVAHTLGVADGRYEPSALADRLLQDVDHAGDLAGWACTARAGDFARYARLVVELAKAGEPIADALLDTAGEHVSDVARALTRGHADIGLALTGGLAETMKPRLTPDMRSRLREAAYTGSTGAALLARRAFVEPETKS